MHDFITGLPEALQQDIERLGSVRRVSRGQVIYNVGDKSHELYRLLSGAVKLCNFSLEGKETSLGELRPGDCFGEIGLIDGMPRMGYAVAVKDCDLLVLGKQSFLQLYDKHTEVGWQLNLILCRRLRLLTSLNEDAAGLKIHERLARLIHRLAYSHGCTDEENRLYIEISHEELSKMLGTSRQSVSKELKLLEGEGSIELRYSNIYICNLDALCDRYEVGVGMEQVAATYEDKP